MIINPMANKLRNYRTYKTTFQKEEYFTIKSTSIQSNFSRLRLSAHKLHFETRHHVDAANVKDPSERIYSFCTSNFCGDEYHFSGDLNPYFFCDRNENRSLLAQFSM